LIEKTGQSAFAEASLKKHKSRRQRHQDVFIELTGIEARKIAVIKR
jgi:hypothetical protein